MDYKRLKLPVDERFGPRVYGWREVLKGAPFAYAIAAPGVLALWLVIYVRDLNVAVAVLQVIDFASLAAQLVPLATVGAIQALLVVGITIGFQALFDRNPEFNGRGLWLSGAGALISSLVIVAGLVVVATWIGPGAYSAMFLALALILALSGAAIFARYSNLLSRKGGWKLVFFPIVALVLAGASLTYGALNPVSSPFPRASREASCGLESSFDVVSIQGEDAWIHTGDPLQLEFREGIVPDLHFCRS